MKKVIVLGGGVAGMSAAQELGERGFEVEVYERNEQYVGGKARSINVPATNIQEPDKYLPGEHGFRFFPGFYKHITDSMKKVPVKHGRTAYDNLVTSDTISLTQIGKPPIIGPLYFPKSLHDIRKLRAATKIIKSSLTSEEIVFFKKRVWQLLTSCPERFENEYESVGWWEFLEADRFNKAYQNLLVEGPTRSLVAAKAEEASTRTIGTIFLQLIYTLIPFYSGGLDRVLNGPTNEAWLNPWLSYLESLKVKYFKHHQVMSLQMKDGKIDGAVVKLLSTNKEIIVKGDYYILATPIEISAQLINKEMLKADPSLENIIKLAPNVAWMNGIQFYLNKEFQEHKGHTVYTCSKWALTSISQMQFWADYDLSKRYNGKVKSVFSVDISNWITEGTFNKKKAQDCTIEEVKEEVWKQLKLEINTEKEILTDDMLEYVFLDPCIHPTQESQPCIEKIVDKEKLQEITHLSNKEPILINLINTWGLRPKSYNDISNFFIAGEYIKTNTNLASMEGANEAARRAVNNIIVSCGANVKLCKVWKLKTPLIFRLLQLIDKRKYKRGLKWSSPF